MSALKFLYDFNNQSAIHLQHLQQFDANGIIVYPYKVLIIVHNYYTLRKPQIAILALVQFFLNLSEGCTIPVRLHKQIYK